MPIFLLIRHGENDYVKKGRLPGRKPGVHLNDKGRAQAQAVAEHLSGAPIKAVYTSPLERAVETAEPLAAKLGLEYQVRQGLIEADCGDWTDHTIKSLRRSKAWRSVQHAPALFCFPGGESFGACQQRIASELLSLCVQHDPKDVIACISHSDPIKLAVAYFIGLPLDNFQRLSAAPASITALSIGEAGSHLMTLNFDLGFTLSRP